MRIWKCYYEPGPCAFQIARRARQCAIRVSGRIQSHQCYGGFHYIISVDFAVYGDSLAYNGYRLHCRDNYYVFVINFDVLF